MFSINSFVMDAYTSSCAHRKTTSPEMRLKRSLQRDSKYNSIFRRQCHLSTGFINLTMVIRIRGMPKRKTAVCSPHVSVEAESLTRSCVNRPQFQLPLLHRCPPSDLHRLVHQPLLVSEVP